MNQGTFSDMHDRNGDGGTSYAPTIGCPFDGGNMCGVFYDNDSNEEDNAKRYNCCSRLSKIP